ncbi:AAA family ATPase [Dyella sp.]|uniref:AAA family ATPase n=1 Tax=Dyella sp. TaxID=1869338 RepID=UPI002ED2410D
MSSLDAKHYLLDIALRHDRVPSFDRYPFHLPAVKHLGRLQFHPAITFFVGENGSGKSTLLEAIAVAWGFNPEGGTRNFNFQTRASHSALSSCLRLGRGVARARDGYFLRAESYFNVATEIEKLDEEPAPAPPIINSYGYRSLHEQSHGESFMALVKNRFSGGSFFVLDEPEAALSPTRQMTLLHRMHELVGAGAQFIVATHSPILISYPHAKILEIGDEGLVETPYKETQVFRTTRDFLNAPERHLHHLLDQQ